jgi:hypothetical protein
MYCMHGKGTNQWALKESADVGVPRSCSRGGHAVGNSCCSPAIRCLGWMLCQHTEHTDMDLACR